MQHVFAALTPGNRLVCRVAVHTGLRVGEVLAIPTAKLGTQFWVTERKTGKRKRVNLPRALVDEIRAQAGPEWAFPGARDASKPRTRQAVWADVKRAAKAFRMPHPYELSGREFYKPSGNGFEVKVKEHLKRIREEASGQDIEADS